MEGIMININIFPLVMSMVFSEVDGGNIYPIDLPRGAHLMYLRNLQNPDEIRLLQKYANGETFSDADYETVFSFFLNTSRGTPNITASSNDMLGQFGIELCKDEGIFQYRLKSEYLPKIKSDTWDYIALDLLKRQYMEIIDCFDFGDVRIDLGAWASDFNKSNQSILNALRSALIFTLVSYLHNNDRRLYSRFEDFFESEFYKRVSLVHAIYKTEEAGSIIHYLPIYDSFHNLNNHATADLIRVIQSVLNNDQIVLDERNMVINRLIEGAEELHGSTDPRSIALESSLIKPVVNYIAEIQAADEELKAASTLNNEKLYKQTVSSCYYAMMHAAKAFLERQGKLADWDASGLNVKESHRNLEKKIEAESNAGTITQGFYADFLYVKDKRWIADYNVTIINDTEATECYTRAVSFVNEIKRLTAV